MGFDNAKVGDKVYSIVHGIGKIILKSSSIIRCNFTGLVGNFDFYTDGKYYERVGERILFYIDDEGNRLETRPKDKTDWSKVAVDSKIRSKDGRKRHFAKYENGYVFCFPDGVTSWSAEEFDSPVPYDKNFVELVEE